jgi:hypothetical protein
MFYLLVVPVLVVMLCELRYLVSLRSHDRVLFPFCVLRDEIIAFLAAHHSEMTADDYLYARRMVTAINHTVSIYKNHRHKFFNFRAFIKFLRGYKVSAEEIAKIPRTERVEIREFEQRLNMAMFRGFACYTPFLRSETAARILIAVMVLLGRLGISLFADRVKESRELIQTVRAQADHFNDQGLRTA